MEGAAVRHRTVEANGISMHVAEAGGEGAEGNSRPAVLFLHGFPELWYSWRHQLEHLAARGYRCVAPDLRGYGDTTAPPEVSSYSAFHVVGDVVGLLDALCLDKEPGVAEKEFSPANARYIVRQILCSRFTSEADGGKKPEVDDDSPLPPWLTEADVDHFASAFERTGFTGGINYYRNMDRNWDLAAPWADAKVRVPTKFIVGDGDLTYQYPGIKDYIHKGGFKADVPLLEDVVVIPGAGHFIQQEKADEVSKHIYDFISKF
ncbi:uncharacterized protein LOC133913720 isoform X2 [Phragmites australis]|uniref:uncharacterized protein LOC133913720 isoform X2 n=1 Tax=Phragmites australis TaxID=29695 RepID=UPI002D778B22|nr:uncharacterized protein LOC133913720 isoform X2 [Phragmites australis]